MDTTAAAAAQRLRALRAAYRHDQHKCMEIARGVGVVISVEVFNARVDSLTEPGPAHLRAHALCRTAADLRARLVEVEVNALDATEGADTLEAAARFYALVAPVVRELFGLPTP